MFGDLHVKLWLKGPLTATGKYALRSIGFVEITRGGVLSRDTN